MADLEEMVSKDELLVICFQLGQASFAIDTQFVQEVVRVESFVAVHHCPAEIIGIRNLRGKVITIFDLSLKLQLGSIENLSDSRIIIVSWKGELVGLMVDQVFDTLNIQLTDVEPAPAHVSGVQGGYIAGVYHGKNQLISLLNLDEILSVSADLSGSNVSE